MDGGVLAVLADLLLPRECAGCGVPGAVLCRRCAALLAEVFELEARVVPDPVTGTPMVVPVGRLC